MTLHSTYMYTYTVPLAQGVMVQDPGYCRRSTPLECAYLENSEDTRWTGSEVEVQGTFLNMLVKSEKRIEHEISSSSLGFNVVSTVVMRIPSPVLPLQ